MFYFFIFLNYDYSITFFQFVSLIDFLGYDNDN